MSLTEIAIKRPSLIIVLFSVLTLSGLFAYTKLSYELMPDFAPPTVVITTLYPGASPSEVESGLSKKLEDALANLDNVDEIITKSMENVSIITVNFKNGTDLDLAMQEAQRNIENIKKDFPEKAKSPTMSKVGPSDSPIMSIVVTSKLPTTELYQRVDDDILPQLQQLKGMGTIALLGGDKREIRVNVKKEKLQQYGLSLMQVTQAIGQSNMDFPTGRVKTAEQLILVKLAGKFSSLEELKNLVITSPMQGSPVRLRDVADVADGLRDPETIARYNGTDGMLLQIKKQSDANAVEISRSVKAKLAAVEQQYAQDGLTFVVAEDTSDFTLQSVDAVTHDLAIAVILVAAVMLLFLHSLRNAFIVMLAIPASLIATFIMMYVLGFSLNLMTLLAMSLVIGILVDDSIVVLENIYRHLEMGKDPYRATIDGRTEIGFSALSITLVDVVVFLPITFINTTIADILRQFSLVIVFSTLMSLLVCFTLTPWLASRLSRLEHLDPKKPFQRFLLWFEGLIDGYVAWYGRRLKWALTHRGISVAIIGLCFAGLGWVMSLGIMGEELVSQGDQGKFYLKMEYDKTVSTLENARRTKQVEQALLKRPEVKSIVTNIGGPSAAGGSLTGANNYTELMVQLKPVADVPRKETEQFMIDLRKQMATRFAGVDFTASKVGIANSAAPIELAISGEDYPQVLETAAQLKKQIVNIPGANDVQLSVKTGNPEVRIELERDKAANLGLNAGFVGAILQNAYSGNTDSKYSERGTDYDIRVMLEAFDRKNPEDVAELTVPSPMTGQMVKVGQFADVSRTTGPSVLERKNRRSAVTLTAYTVGKSPGAVAADIQTLLDKEPLPKGVEVAWGGDIKRTDDSFAALGLALAIGLVLVYLIMVALYDNFVYPFVVLFSIPVALIGAMLALNVASATMSVFTQLGIIMLMGLVSKNAILIVDFANQLKQGGKKTFEALTEAGKERQRPILMTTIAMVVGMLPIALARGAGAEWKNGLAIVLIGGLTSSMILTVFLVPIVYSWVDDAGVWLRRTFGRKEDTPAGVPTNATL